ncbi:hypothetical protein KUTeg_015209 [Tegillarca granosa]|uniref:Alkaline phosphatase n=1 Tax=Tegillarca granosa TaxID=220873 RepID=A0ABQ9EUP9_TEGGR|nr:hypothetical protein KUTeg_015209 [Tegillarca granosa]
MLESFSKTGSMSIQKACTSDLQTFHQPTTFYEGEPVTADKIPTKHGFSDEHLADPRPEQYKNWSGYNDYVRNNTINFCASNAADIAIRYLHPKVDIQFMFVFGDINRTANS